MSEIHLGYAVLEQIDAVPDLFKTTSRIRRRLGAISCKYRRARTRLLQILLTAIARYVAESPPDVYSGWSRSVWKTRAIR